MRESVDALSIAEAEIDAVVWPESMFSGNGLWMVAKPDAKPPDFPGVETMTAAEFQQAVKDHREYFCARASDFQRVLALQKASRSKPHLIVGCGVVRHGEKQEWFSGCLHIGPDSQVSDWVRQDSPSDGG